MLNREIETKIERLPDDVKREVFDYIEFLAAKYRRSGENTGKLNYKWEGCLAGIKTTAVELQHKSAEWR